MKQACHKSTWETMFRQPKMMIKVSTFLRVLFIPFLWKKGGSFLHSNVAAFHIGMATFRLTTTDGWEGKDSTFCTSNICHLKSSQNSCLRRFFAFLSEAIAHWQKSEKSFSFFVDKCKSDRVVDKFYCFAKATHMCVKSSFKAYKT